MFNKFFKVTLLQRQFFKWDKIHCSYGIDFGNKQFEFELFKHKTILSNERFEVFTAVTMKNGVFWDVTPCGSYFFAACVGC
jgi:aspartyl-tRNA synthetase